jgi:hypothetical protein
MKVEKAETLLDTGCRYARISAPFVMTESLEHSAALHIGVMTMHTLPYDRKSSKADANGQ